MAVPGSQITVVLSFDGQVSDSDAERLAGKLAEETADCYAAEARVTNPPDKVTPWQTGCTYRATSGFRDDWSGPKVLFSIRKLETE